MKNFFEGVTVARVFLAIFTLVGGFVLVLAASTAWLIEQNTVLGMVYYVMALCMFAGSSIVITKQVKARAQHIQHR